MKLLHLNINQGLLLDKIVSYANAHNFDIFHFQEVAKASLSRNKKDNFIFLSENLADYHGVHAPTFQMQNDPLFSYGNATFTKKIFRQQKQEVFWIKEFTTINTFEKKDWMSLGKNAIVTELLTKNEPITFINTHLAWGPTPDDEPYKVKLGEKLFEFVKNVQTPFVLTGDFNVTPDSEIVTMFNSIARNLTQEHNMTNTLNPRIWHKAKGLFPPGLAVDYIFVSKEIVVEQCRLIEDIDLSDHLGFSIEFSLL